MLFKSIASELKADGAGRTITGYGAAFGNRDLVGDVIEPSAFTKTIQERGPQSGRGKAGMIKLSGSSGGVANHRATVGVHLNLMTDAKGLMFEGKADPTPPGDETLARVQSGSLAHGSIGYDAIKAMPTQDGVDDSTGWPIITRHLQEVKLYDCGPVDHPANEEAPISSQLKSLMGADDPLVIVQELPLLFKGWRGRKARLTFEERKIAHSLMTGLPALLEEIKSLLASEGPTDLTTPAGMAALREALHEQAALAKSLLAGEAKGQCAYHKSPITGGSWDAGEQVKKATIADLKKMSIFWTGDGTNKGDYHLMHHNCEPPDYPCPESALSAAWGRIDQTHGVDAASAKAHLRKHYHDGGKKAPDEN